MISYIVSTKDRPLSLEVCLGSLQCQIPKSGMDEIVVVDNTRLTEMYTQVWNQDICTRWGASWVGLEEREYRGQDTCYHTVEYSNPRAEWLCFPSDDSYYVPQFAEIMLAAATKNEWEMVYCDVLYDPRYAYATTGRENEYSVMITDPLGAFDKTGFLITRRAFEEVGGWPPHPSDWRDRALAQAVVRAGIRHGKAPGVMVVHN